MNKNFITALVLIGIVIAGFVLLASDGNQKNSVVPDQVAAKLAASETSHEFGQISMAAGLVRHNFKVKNQSDQPVEIKSLYTSCMCTEAFWLLPGRREGPFGMPGHTSVHLDQTLGAQEEATVEVVFDPAAHGPAGIGPITRQVKLETSDGYLEFNVSALVKP